jgi:hypothetical protein
MDQLLTVQFWHDQWAFVASAPSVIVPLVLVAAFIGWRAKGAVDDGEIRGYRASKEAAEAQLRLAHDQHEPVKDYVAYLEAKVLRQDAMIAALNTSEPPAARPHVEELARSNTEIKTALTTLALSTANLSTTLTIVGPKGRTGVTLPSG